MSSTTYGGIFRELPILPFPAGSSSVLVRGMVVQWNTSTVGPWLSGGRPLGVATGDADRDLGQCDIYIAKGCTLSIKCNVGVVPNPGDLLYWSAPGLVSNVSDGNSPFARAVGVGFNGYIEAIVN
jgi:hypothetical protein